MPGKKKVLLFSTLNPYPFWAGSENFWFDFVADKRVHTLFDFHLLLADSPTTRIKAEMLSIKGAKVGFYKHFNVSFARRNYYKIQDKLNGKKSRTLPWYDQIKKDKYDLVWFNVAGLGDLQDLVYPVQQCKKLGIPYWLILQHGFEDFFLTNQNEIEAVTEVATSAKRFVFISEKNRISLERAIGVKLKNSFQSVNSLRNEIISEAFKISETNLPKDEGVARFFNLGRFAPKDKAQHLLLEAFSNSKWRNRDWQLSFIGVSGFGEFYLKRLSGFYGLEKEKIKILPHTEHVFEEISKNDVLLMPSLSEGTPFAMIESMACGRPALGTPIGGIPELIIQNKTGWLARTTDIIDVSEAMENVWQDRSQWSTFGNNCRKFIVENYNQENTFARLLSKLIDDTN